MNSRSYHDLPSDKWLEANRDLRMDANNSLWSEVRRHFHLDRYEFAKRFSGQKRVLDGACGTGYGTAVLSELAESVTGIDVSEEAINYARKNYERENTIFQRAFVEFTDFESGSFDLVVSFETVEHTLCPKAHMREITRLLAHEGIAILSIPNGWGYTQHHFFDFNFGMIGELVEENFGEAEWYAQIPGTMAMPTSGKITPLNHLNQGNAECIIAVCRSPKTQSIDDRRNDIMSEIYENAFQRHRDYLTLLAGQNTSFKKRLINGIKRVFGY